MKFPFICRVQAKGNRDDICGLQFLTLKYAMSIDVNQIHSYEEIPFVKWKNDNQWEITFGIDDHSGIESLEFLFRSFAKALPKLQIHVKFKPMLKEVSKEEYEKSERKFREDWK